MSEGVAIEILESDSPNEMTLNMGPQHPSTHGVFRLIMQLDGETVVGVKPVMGYLHRSTEKLGEARTYVQGTVLTDRMDYLSPMTTNWAYALAIEKLAGLEVPERAEYIRVIVSELSRIASHQVAIGTFGADVGTWFTPLVYCFREREEILDLFMLCAGVRMNPSYIRFGGVARDLSEEFLARCQAFIDKMPAQDRRVRVAADQERDLPGPDQGDRACCRRSCARTTASPGRSRGPAASPTTSAAPSRTASTTASTTKSRSASAATPTTATWSGSRRCARASRSSGRRSATSPTGEIRGRMPKILRPPKGEAYARIEGPKGEIGFYLISDGSTSPYRYKVRAPSYINLTVLSQLTIGHKVADAVVILGSFDIVMGEVDR